MIIRPREAGLKVADFLSGLQRAASSTVRLRWGRDAEPSTNARGFSTGWLLTERLVVSFWMDAEHAWLEQEDEHGSVLRIEAQVVSDTRGSKMQPVLLRLSRPLPAPVLTMSPEPARAGDPVFLLQFAHGELSEQLSLGRVIGVDGPRLQYDANTSLGSGGAPVFDNQWRLLGMHLGHTHERDANFGITNSAIIEHLSGSTAWPEIAAHHRLADVQAARQHLHLRDREFTGPQPPGDALLGAAVRWSIDPRTLSKEDATRLRKLVINPSAPRWILRVSERQHLLRSAGSLERLRAARGTDAVPERGQAVIDRLLAGPPYELAAMSEESLSDWLQVARWFADIAPGVPTPNEINRALKGRRLRARLKQIAGPGFKGRRKELDTLRSWYDAPRVGPMVVTGIGGMGKSALVARFAEGLPPEALLFWLDFDRADLAPDDAVSVLEALGEQVVAQVEGVEPPRVQQEDWKTAARELGARLAGALGTARACPLLVLDSFEVAQHAERYQELWPVLETLSSELPGLRVLVTGRAEVKNLVLQARPAVSLHLSGLERPDAEAWLRDRGLQESEVIEQVLELATGVPLILVLAVRLVEAGGEVKDLPRTLSQKVIEGVLYHRILDRVQDFTLRPLAMGALVLRRLTADMIQPVLGGLVELPEREPEALLAALAKELALVEGSNVLRLRPDVRSAALKLLERDKSELVKKIDARAIDWYARQDLNDPAITAELVYHRLRVGDLEGAAAVWRDESTSYFQVDEDELPETARAWLRERVGGATGSAAPPTLASWEREAVLRIREALARGLWRALPRILGEHPERSAESPLVFFDAYAHWRAGDRAAAQKVLDDAGDAPPGGTSWRNRAVLRALLAAEECNWRGADEWLARIDRVDLWANRAEGYLEAQAVHAARVRLTVDLPGEVELLGLIHGGSKTAVVETLRRVLPSADVVLPRLRELLTQYDHALESYAPLFLDMGSDALSPLTAEVLSSHQGTLVPKVLLAHLVRPMSAPDDSGPWSPDELPPDTKLRLLQVAGVEDISTEVHRAIELGLRLMLSGVRRWRLMLSGGFFSNAYTLAAEHPSTVEPLRASIAGTLALGGGKLLGRELVGPGGSVVEVVERCLTELQRFPVREKRLRSTLEVVRQDSDRVTQRLLDSLPAHQGLQPDDVVPEDVVARLLARLRWLGEPAYLCLVYHLLTPDPLERLVHQLAGIPSSVEP
jgi:hypothetical protein